MDTFLIFAAVGFLAQMVDGALGMGYGVVASTVLISSGVSPAMASASTHLAKLFTTAVSGGSHIFHGNVDWRLFARVAPAGIVGGILGTFLVTGATGAAIRPYVIGYLGLLGVYIFARAFFPLRRRALRGAVVVPVGTAGGFGDAIGGGGWGPIVTTSLIGAGGEARTVVGTVNTAEFVVTVAISASFVVALLTGHWEDAKNISDNGLAVGGLIVGGLLAAPLAGYAVKVLPRRLLTAGVGLLIITLAVVQLAPLVF